ncbi:WG repeat-containing protein [Sporomusa sp.]|uniref:WG repeat-containing protein n=1 Tax=Sporomusa sp. TaxID=2078658 RepID=UPI002C48813B|nr:WG repeat-containing protein [Sporomusa sp.]HWR06523.1 WG repeat-containing protein [Sporomusa sp.]
MGKIICLPVSIYRLHSIVFGIALLVLINIFTSTVTANANYGTALYIIKQDGKYGYGDADGHVVIPPVYLQANRFSEGVAAVQIQKGFWGMINTKGEIVGTLRNVDEVREFSEGLAVVRRGAKYGYIDKKQLVVPFKFDAADDFSEGLAVVAKREGNTILEKLHNIKYGYIDKDGTEVIDYQFRSAGKFKEGIAPVSSEATGFRWGYIDKKGHYVIEAKYFTAREFSDGLAPVTIALGQSGFIDHQGSLVIPPLYSWTYSFSEGLARVAVDGKYGFIDKNGNMVIKPMFNYADDFSNGLAQIYDKSPGFSEDIYEDVSFGYIDKSGNVRWQITK